VEKPTGLSSTPFSNGGSQKNEGFLKREKGYKHPACAKGKKTKGVRTEERSSLPKREKCE